MGSRLYLPNEMDKIGESCQIISKVKPGITGFKILCLFLLLILLTAFCGFYYKYVPLVKPFQMILIPVLLVSFISTVLNREWGILFFVFTFPIINNLPYFFGIFGHIPHAPTALVLFLAFLLGLLINILFTNSRLDFNHPIFRPLILLCLLIIISGIITFFRYANYYPFLTDRIYELIVNVNSVRVGGAIMSDIFNSLNYLTGFLLFVILFSYIKSREFIRKLLATISLAIFISLIFAFIQKYYLSAAGNMPFWTGMNQINATFKDPNSFGVFLSAYIPLLLGIIIYSRKYQKIFFMIQLILSLFIFPSTGSRSSFLALIISGSLFLLLLLFHYKVSLKKRFVLVPFIILIVALTVLSTSYFTKQSSLKERLGLTVEKLLNKDSVNTIFTGKIYLWKIAGKMIEDYPVTGVGVGAFIVELPNYGKLIGLPHEATDSAENYFFQVASELGIIGLLLVFWLFFEVIKQMRESWKISQKDDRDKFLLMGAISGVISIFINYLFHSYIGSFEVKYFFWLLVGLIFALPRIDKDPTIRKQSGRSFRIAAFCLALVFGGTHLWNSTRALSIKSRTEIFDWNQDFGLYEREKDSRGFAFQWAKKSAGITIENVGNTLVLPLIASHPDIEKNPVKLKIFQADHNFRKEKLLSEIMFKEKTWTYFELPLSNQNAKKICLVFETNRVWSPLKYLKVPDARSLAVGLGETWFRYPSGLPNEKIKSIQTIYSKKWGGKYKEYLITNSTSYIEFRVNEKNAALRLWVMGQKAFNNGPHIIIRLDDIIIGKTLLTEETWTPLIFTPEMSEGEHVLSVEFINDFYVPEKGQDRNVVLGDLELIYLKAN